MAFTYPNTPRHNLPKGPYQMVEASTCIPIRDAGGKTIASVPQHERDLGVAKMIVKLPELLETAMWAYAALIKLANDATTAADFDAFSKRLTDVRSLLNDLRS